MKKIAQIAAFSLIFFYSCRENEQEKKYAEKEGDKREVQLPSPNKADVEKAVATFNEAMVNPERDLLERLCADELSYGHSSGIIQNKAEFIDDLINGPFNFLSVDSPEQTIQLSGDTAIVRHIFLASATNDGKPVDIRIGNMQVYKSDNEGKWRLLARQAYKL